MALPRKLTAPEERLVEFLVSKAKLNLPADWKENLLASPIDQAGLGSLNLFPNGLSHKKRDFATEASECQFKDADGVHVIATLTLDAQGNLFELDIWKTDFSALQKIPDKLV